MGPAGTAAMGATAWVTPRRCDSWEMHTNATVHDTGRDGWCGPAANAGGDVGSREQVTVPNVPAVRAIHNPSCGLRDTLGANRAGG